MALFSRCLGLTLSVVAILSTACVGPVDTLVGPSPTKPPTTTPTPQPAQPACQFSWSFPRLTYPSGNTVYSMHLPAGSTYRINVSSTCGWRPQLTVAPFGVGITRWEFSGQTGYIDLSVAPGVGGSFNVYVDADKSPFPRLATGSVCIAQPWESCGSQ